MFEVLRSEIRALRPNQPAGETTSRKSKTTKSRDTSAFRTEWATAATSQDECVNNDEQPASRREIIMYSSKTSQHKVPAARAPGRRDGDDDDDSDWDARRRARDNHLADANKRRAVRLNDNPEAARPPSAGLIWKLATEIMSASRSQANTTPPSGDTADGTKEL